MSIAAKLRAKKCNFDTIISKDIHAKEIAVFFLWWQDKIGTHTYTHRLKVGVAYMGLALLFYEQYEALAKSETDTVSADFTQPAEHIYVQNDVRSLRVVLETRIEAVAFGRLEWGRLMRSIDLNKSMLAHFRCIHCIQYLTSASIVMTECKQKQEYRECEHDIINSLDRDILSSAEFIAL